MSLIRAWHNMITSKSYTVFWLHDNNTAVRTGGSDSVTILDGYCSDVPPPSTLNVASVSLSICQTATFRHRELSLLVAPRWLIFRHSFPLIYFYFVSGSNPGLSLPLSLLLSSITVSCKPVILYTCACQYVRKLSVFASRYRLIRWASYNACHVKAENS